MSRNGRLNRRQFIKFSASAAAAGAFWPACDYFQDPEEKRAEQDGSLPDSGFQPEIPLLDRNVPEQYERAAFALG